MTKPMSARDRFLNALMATDTGREYLYALSTNLVDISFALQNEADFYAKSGRSGEAERMVRMAKRLNLLAVESRAADIMSDGSCTKEPQA